MKCLSPVALGYSASAVIAKDTVRQALSADARLQDQALQTPALDISLCGHSQAAERGVKKIRVHLLTDGRDCEDGTSIKLMDTLQKDLQALEEKGVDAKVASGGGRMCTTMDRYEVLSHSCTSVRGSVAHELIILT